MREFLKSKLVFQSILYCCRFQYDTLSENISESFFWSIKFVLHHFLDLKFHGFVFRLNVTCNTEFRNPETLITYRAVQRNAKNKDALKKYLFSY